MHPQRIAMPRPTEPERAATTPQAPHARRGQQLYLVVKSGTEWAVSLLLLAAAAPLLAVLAVLIRCSSPGPVFYTQTRLGRHGRPFRIWKLRTMTHGCEAATGPVWSLGQDPRVTPVGRWLRDTHLDELPQLLNVLRMEMSLIGPRPERPEIAARIARQVPEFRSRLAVKPGITGLAQMRLPADRDLHTVRRKLAHDLRYVARVGPSLDARIALSTVLHFAGVAASALSKNLVKGPATELEADDGTPGEHTAGRTGYVALDELAQAA